MTMLVCGRWIFAHAERQLLTVSSSQSCLLETITGAETIKASGVEDHAYRRWGALFGDQLRASLAYRSRTNVAEGALSLFSVGTPLLLLWFGAHQVLAGSLTLGSMLALNAIGLGVFLAAVTVRFRDFRLVVPLALQLSRYPHSTVSQESLVSQPTRLRPVHYHLLASLDLAAPPSRAPSLRQATSTYPLPAPAVLYPTQLPSHS